MPGLLPNVDPDGLLEYSVVYTDRSLNHMSDSFQKAMNDVSSSLKEVYNAEAVVLVPGGGTYAMEAVARQFATDQSCLVLRNGWFSFRWSQIFEMGNIPSEEIVLKASRVSEDSQAPFAPPDIDEVVELIKIKNQLWFLLLMSRPHQALFFLITISNQLLMLFILLEVCLYWTVLLQELYG